MLSANTKAIIFNIPGSRTKELFEIKNKYGKEFLFNGKDNQMFFVFSREATEEILINKYSSFVKSGGWDKVKGFVGNGLLTSEEPDHLKNKRLLYSSKFNNKTIENHVEKIYEIVSNIITPWENRTIEIQSEVSKLVYDTITKIFLFSSNSDKFFSDTDECLKIIADKIAIHQYDYQFDYALKTLKGICKKIVDERLWSDEIKEDFLQHIIDNYKKDLITLQDVYDETATVLFTGHETLTNFLSWSIYILSTNPNWINLIKEEYKGFNKENILQNLEKDSFTNNFINEVLRMYPPAWMTERKAIEDVVINGTMLKKGTDVIISSLVSHRDPDVFKDPETFSPDRWNYLKESELSPGNFFPFNMGKRMCIGKYFSKIEAHILLGEICSKYKLNNLGNLAIGAEKFTYKFHEDVTIFVSSDDFKEKFLRYGN
jgi:cytochrome P450